MKEYKKIYLLSDIHGSIKGLEKASKVCTRESPLYVVGDLFNHQFGAENKILSMLLRLIDEQRCNFIFGNHDLFLDIMFNPKGRYEQLYTNLCKPKNERKMQVLISLFDYEYYQSYIDLKKSLETSENIDLGIKSFYNEVKKLNEREKYKANYKQIEKLLAAGIDYDQFTVSGKRFLLSHSGEPGDYASRNTARNSFKLKAEYDYGIMGHLTIPLVERMIEEEGDMIDFKQNFELNPTFDDFLVEGNYMYNRHSKMIMIDDGSYQNVVTLSCK